MNQEYTEDYLVFKNPGELDMNMIRIMGVSVKESDNPIGFFGTGLKFAIATILRLGGTITIFTGGEKHTIDTLDIELRGKSFKQITLDGQPLGITTELGKQWKPWMAVRELYSNALDEGGSVSLRSGVKDVAPYIGSSLPIGTAIVVTGEAFVDVWKNRSEYFIDPQEVPVEANEFVHSYEGPSKSIFYRGIKVGEGLCQTAYKHNIQSPIDLTEDRTIRYDFQYREAVEQSILVSQNKGFIHSLLTAAVGYDETRLTFKESYSCLAPSKVFQDTITSLAAQRPARLNLCAVTWAEKRFGEKQDFEPHEMNDIQRAQLKKAIQCVASLGFGPDILKYKINVVRWLGSHTHGLAKNGEIFLSKECFNQGTKYLFSTLLEEFVHCHYQLRDETRELQTWLFDRIATLTEEFILKEAI